MLLPFQWLMTYDAVPEIRELYQTNAQTSFNLSYSAYERRLGSELLIHPLGLDVPSEALNALPYAAA